MNQRGFSQIILFGVVAVLILSGVSGFLVLREKEMPSSEKMVRQEVSSQKIEDGTRLLETRPQNTGATGLGSLCSGEKECISFCLNNRGRCEEYCEGNKIELCRIIFPPEEINKLGSQQVRYKNILDREWSHGQCKNEGTINFEVAPMNPEDISVIIPMGDMVGGHVTPIDHLYFYPPKSHQANIYAPADGTIVYISAANKSVGTGADIPTTYTVVIEHTCDFYTLFGLLDNLSPKIKEKTGTINEQAHVRIPIVRGEIIGNLEENSLDYNVFYIQAPPKQWIVPEHYNTELGKKFSVDPFDYYTEPVRSKLLEKNLRTVPPVGGKFDHDIDGTLSGNWFEENKNWYAGLPSGRFGAYWKTHLSFSPNPVDPSGFVISLGDFNGEAQQFGVKGNSPKPPEVTPASGVIKYELVQKGYVHSSGRSWTFGDNAVHDLRFDLGSQINGVVLVQLLDNRRLKFEAFPGKTAAGVSEFTSAARIYER